MNEQSKIFLELLNGLNEKQRKLDLVSEMIGSETNHPLLEKEMELVAKMLVKSMGGHDGHYEYLNSAGFTGCFYDYFKEEIDQDELLKTIKEAIENDWSGEVGVSIIRA